MKRQELENLIREQVKDLLEKKRKKKKKKKKKKSSGKKDACYHKVRSRYSVWPSAYASGALVKCRKVGAKNWGKSTTKEQLELYEGKVLGCWCYPARCHGMYLAAKVEEVDGSL
jgi:hypothetical protein